VGGAAASGGGALLDADLELDGVALKVSHLFCTTDKNTLPQPPSRPALVGTPIQELWKGRHYHTRSTYNLRAAQAHRVAPDMRALPSGRRVLASIVCPLPSGCRVLASTSRHWHTSPTVLWPCAAPAVGVDVHRMRQPEYESSARSDAQRRLVVSRRDTRERKLISGVLTWGPRQGDMVPGVLNVARAQASILLSHPVVRQSSCMRLRRLAAVPEVQLPDWMTAGLHDRLAGDDQPAG
jgi:hypothetical protein